MKNIVQKILFCTLVLSLVLVVMGILIYLAGADFLEAFKAFYLGTFGSLTSISNVLVIFVPLLLIAEGLTIAFRAKVINIGAEGQFYIGALFATLVALAFPHLSSWIIIPLMVVMGFIGGCVCAFLPALLKARYRINELITTIMMVYIVYLLINYLVTGPLMDTTSIWATFSHTQLISPSARLPILIPGTRLHAGLIIAVLCLIAVWILLEKSVLGFKLRIVGTNPRAASYVGINHQRSIITALLLSGGLAGIAGMVQVSGVMHRLSGDISQFLGFIGIPVIMLGRMNIWGVVMSSFIFAIIIAGGSRMSGATGLPTITLVIQGTIIFSIFAADYLIRRMKA